MEANKKELKGDYLVIAFCSNANEFLKGNGRKNTRFVFDSVTGEICIVEDSVITTKFEL